MITDKERLANTRNTMQRNLVLETIRSLASHPTAEEVYENVILRDRRISKATVYRNLALLASMGQIRKVPMPGTEPDRYDFNLSPHFHAKCRNCGRMVDAYSLGKDSDFSFSSPFKVEDVELVLTGLCGECARKLDQPAEER